MASVSEFLIERLISAKVGHVFGVPGDYVLSFCKRLSDSKSIDFINTTDENHAGFAADAYSRVHGVGCIAVTYNVGALKTTNAIGCAFSEKSPVIVISGSPGIKERGAEFLLHHTVRNFKCQREVFKNITCATAVLNDPNTAGFEIDRVLTAMHYFKQPIYIELPRDVAEKPISYDVYRQGTPVEPQTDKQNLKEALDEVVEWIKQSERPVLMAGVEVARCGLGDDLIKFAEKHNLPIITTLLSKSVVHETHPLFSGVYVGAASQSHVRDAVENTDCLILLGEQLTDMTLSFLPLPTNLEKRNCVCSTIEGLKVKNHTYTNVNFIDFCQSLFKTDMATKKSGKIVGQPKLKIEKTDKISNAGLFEKINSILDENMVVLSDIGDSLFGAADLEIKHKHSFLGAAYYASMGTSIPGALGVQMANARKRPIVLVGDGAFQMSCTEISTIVSKKLNPIIFVLNNHGYTTERLLMEGPFNDLREWEYHKITEMIGGGVGLKVETTLELEEAIKLALPSKDTFIINVLLDSKDISLALRRITESLAKKV